MVADEDDEDNERAVERVQRREKGGGGGMLWDEVVYGHCREKGGDARLSEMPPVCIGMEMSPFANHRSSVRVRTITTGQTNSRLWNNPWLSELR